MYAQVIELHLGPESLEGLERFVRSELFPALREQSGFCGALSLTDRERAATLLVLLWETEAQAQAPATVTALLASRSCSVTVWEVDART